jgi:EmrB/QacA subfamily drug resistance transporter
VSDATTKRVTLIVVCTAIGVVGIDNSILNVALPTLSKNLNASPAQLQWIVDSYAVAYAGLMLTGGSLADRFGRARLMIVGLCLFGFASGLAAASTAPATLIACRALMGCGAALLTPASMSILTNVFPDPKERSRAFSLWAASASIGFATGPVAGGILLDRFWWGSAFLVNVPIIAVLVVLAAPKIPNSQNPNPQPLDPIGVVLSVLSLGVLLWTTIEAPTRGWVSVGTLATYALGVVLFVLFVRWERSNPEAMLDLTLFEDRRFSIPTLGAAAMVFSNGGTLFVLSQFLQSVRGYSVLGAGLRLMPVPLGASVFAILSPRIAARIGNTRAVTFGLSIMTIGCVLIGQSDRHTPFWLLAITMVIFSAGQGISFTPMLSLAMEAVPTDRAGVASGANNCVRQISAAAGVAVIGSALAARYRPSLASHTANVALSAAQRADAAKSITKALNAATKIGGPTGEALRVGARQAFVDGMHIGAFVAAIGGIAGVALILGGRARSTSGSTLSNQ